MNFSFQVLHRQDSFFKRAGMKSDVFSPSKRKSSSERSPTPLGRRSPFFPTYDVQERGPPPGGEEQSEDSKDGKSRTSLPPVNYDESSES